MVFSVLFGIVNGLIYMLFMTLLPDSVENDPDKLFFYQFSFSSYGIVEFILLIAQIYVFTLILTQRVRDFGFKYPITIALIFTIGTMGPYTISITYFFRYNGDSAFYFIIRIYYCIIIAIFE
ncbi:Uncharacterised protein [Proteus mirabilis]|uniref:Uncharacterized protein n=1 Tax=Proteus mirabilis TaxID=584 RepID=A0A2X2DNW5_PROMI|nr:Uncharacterised protein [Proteus mirabilis]